MIRNDVEMSSKVIQKKRNNWLLPLILLNKMLREQTKQSKTKEYYKQKIKSKYGRLINSKADNLKLKIEN